ncbi:MAG: hypothetical protein ACNA8W_22190, partial [Bradymonadaceae bacterium]
MARESMDDLDEERARVREWLEALDAYISRELKQKTNGTDVVDLPIKKKVIRPLPQKPNGPLEHSISDQDYEFILKVFRHEGRSF